MKTKINLLVAIVLLATLTISIAAFAGRRVVVRKGPKRTTVVVKKRHVARPHVVVNLPAHHTKVVVRDRDYFYHAGVWYGSGPNGYRLIAAPRGARVRVLPVGYSLAVVSGVTYYRYYGTYYQLDDKTAEYYVVDPPESQQTTDIVYLVDGEVLRGTYLGGNEETIDFQVGDDVNEIDLTDIVSISFEPPSE